MLHGPQISFKRDLKLPYGAPWSFVCFGETTSLVSNLKPLAYKSSYTIEIEAHVHLLTLLFASVSDILNESCGSVFFFFSFPQVLGDEEKRTRYDSGEDLEDMGMGGGGGGFNPFGGGGQQFTFHFEGGFPGGGGGFPGGGFGGFHF